MTNPVTRLAPSPTGTLHVGNARTFLINWALARNLGWRIVLRIEDLDLQRVRRGAAEQCLAILEWLGIDFDEGPTWQSRDLAPYERAMRTLTDSQLAYSCSLTRSQIQHAASAPHGEDGELRFPAEFRPNDPSAYRFERSDTNYRFVTTDIEIAIHDRVAGRSVHRPFEEVGDFIVWTKLGVPAYQLAVVVDDARQGVTDVVRGDDLLPSAARQALIYRALDLREPNWWHLPLITGSDGKRLAKRHGHSHLEKYREAGVPAQRIVGLLAWWSGASADRCEMSAQEFRSNFTLERLPRAPIAFTAEDHAWLMQGARVSCA